MWLEQYYLYQSSNTTNSIFITYQPQSPQQTILSIVRKKEKEKYCALRVIVKYKYIKRFFLFEKQYIKRLDTRGQEPPTMMDCHYAVSPLIFKSNIAGSSPFLNISFSKVSSQYWRLCYDEYYLQSNKNKNINNNNLFMFSLTIFGPYLTKYIYELS